MSSGVHIEGFDRVVDKSLMQSLEESTTSKSQLEYLSHSLPQNPFSPRNEQISKQPTVLGVIVLEH